MKLFILTEKNTQQANPFAEALFGHTKKNEDGFYAGFWQGKETVIGYLGGHLYEQLLPEEYTESWDSQLVTARELIQCQPLLPSVWKVKPKKGKVGNQTIARLLKKVQKWGRWADDIYQATDPDREGTVLGREALRELGLLEKTSTRVYVNDMAKSQIVRAFLKPSPLATDDLLFLAGQERRKVDWLGGIACFGLMKAENQLRGLEGKGTGSIGRVKTGVAIFIYNNNQTIDHWDPELPENNKYGIAFQTEDGLILKSTTQFSTREEAEQWVRQYGHTSHVNVERKDSIEDNQAPALLKLNDIQTWAKAQKIKKAVLPYLEDLALKGYITYPRTSVNVVSSSFQDEALAPVAEQVRDLLGLSISLPQKNTFEKPWVNNAKVKHAGHTANTYGNNIPSQSTLESMEKETQMLYRFISLRTLAPMMPVGKDNVAHYSAVIGNLTFKARATQVKELGWREVPELTKSSNKSGELDSPFISGGQKAIRLGIQRIRKNPPVRITEKNLPKLMDKYGLGTPATQEGIIKQMFDYKQIENKKEGKGKNYLIVTSIGEGLVHNQPLYTFEYTKELGLMLQDIQGLGESDTPLPAGIALQKMAEKIVVWRESLLERVSPSMTFFKAKHSMKNKEGKAISFKPEWSTHKFTDTELEQLARGEEISFVKDGKTITGMLKKQTYKGKKFIGFMPDWNDKYEKAKGVGE
ncbi:DNA topoisomerase [Lactococcus petauri]|uniref:Topo IA-type catalytic domain-containing protein n=1 Tax=Lactococcus petauri TaxID=1940789 RepID=A0A252CEZ4_9LACT|nr:DNA topoisomerase [Lactococcus petauri]OUK05157.1 hypothetical protein BZZ03_00095 [Lactococcus petauri]